MSFICVQAIRFTNTDLSNFDKPWSDAHFVFFLFHYHCTRKWMPYIYAIRVVKYFLYFSRPHPNLTLVQKSYRFFVPHLKTSQSVLHWYLYTSMLRHTMVIRFVEFSSGGINKKDFCLGINILKGNNWILRIGLVVSCQTLGIILWF